jgi:hypothetical protein
MGALLAKLEAAQLAAVPPVAVGNGDKPASSPFKKPAKVGTTTQVRAASPWAVDDERTRAWNERYRGRYINVPVLLASPEIPIQWRVDQFARDGHHTLLCGAAGVHKTWFVYSLLHGVVTGSPIAGSMACRGGMALHFDAEVGPDGFKSRYHASGYGEGVELYDARSLDLSRQDDQDWMAEVIAHHIKPGEGGLVTYDSLRAVTPGAKENDSDDMVPVVRGITNVARDTGVAIVGIHHSGWDVGRMRGSSGIFDQCDAAFSWMAATDSGAIARSEDEAGFERWLICKPGTPGQKFNIGRAPKTRRFNFDEQTCQIMGVDEVEPRKVESWDVKILRAVAAGKVTRKARKAAAEALECSNASSSAFAKAWNDVHAAERIVWSDHESRYQLAEGVELPPDPNVDVAI